METNARNMQHCTYPRCSCKATGVYCDNKPAPKKRKGITRQTPKQKVKMVEKQQLVLTDAAFYLIIWQEREHKCQNCGAPVFEFSILLFHHILAKRPDGGYPQYRHCKWNIWILCWQCHDTHDNGNIDSPTIAKLRAEYHRLLKLHEDGKLKVESPEGFHAPGTVQGHQQADLGGPCMDNSPIW